MKEWWRKKKEASRKKRKDDDKYTFGDFIFDVLLFVPELIFWPFRIMFWMIRGFTRFIVDIF